MYFGVCDILLAAIQFDVCKMKHPTSLLKALSAIVLSLLFVLTLAVTPAFADNGDAAAPEALRTVNTSSTIPTGGNPCLGVCPNLLYFGTWDTNNDRVVCTRSLNGSGPRINTRVCQVECSGDNFSARVFRSYCVISSF